MGSLSDPTAIDATTSPFKVLVVGGSYGGLSVALNLQDLCRGKAPRCGPTPDKDQDDLEIPHIPIHITIVDERDGFYHTIGGPLALASETHAEKMWVKYQDIPALRSPNIHMLHGSVQSFDPEGKVATFTARGMGTETSQIEYDFLVAAAGLRRVWPVVPQSLRRKQYLLELGEHTRTALTGRHGAVIVGGGAVGVEMAAELKYLNPQIKVTLVHSRDKLLSAEPLPEELKDKSLELVKDAGVHVLMSHRLDKTEESQDPDGNTCHKVHFTNGRTMLADQVIMAISNSIPATTFIPSEALNQAGYVRVQPTLEFPADTPNSAHHFAVGDLVQWSGIKRCGGAMHMGFYAANNMHMTMVQERRIAMPIVDEPWAVLKLDEIPPMIGLAVGNQAVAYWPEAGVTAGEDILKGFFGDDLGFTICWNHLRLGSVGGEKVVG